MILQRTHKSCCASQEPELLLAAIVVAFASLVKVVSRPPGVVQARVGQIVTILAPFICASFLAGSYPMLRF